MKRLMVSLICALSALFVLPALADGYGPDSYVHSWLIIQLDAEYNAGREWSPPAA